jgi:hypothetical protein
MSRGKAWLPPVGRRMMGGTHFAGQCAMPWSMSEFIDMHHWLHADDTPVAGIDIPSRRSKGMLASTGCPRGDRRAQPRWSI